MQYHIYLHVFIYFSLIRTRQHETTYNQNSKIKKIKIRPTSKAHMNEKFIYIILKEIKHYLAYAYYL